MVKNTCLVLFAITNSILTPFFPWIGCLNERAKKQTLSTFKPLLECTTIHESWVNVKRNPYYHAKLLITFIMFENVTYHLLVLRNACACLQVLQIASKFIKILVLESKLQYS